MHSRAVPRIIFPPTSVQFFIFPPPAPCCPRHPNSSIASKSKLHILHCISLNKRFSPCIHPPTHHINNVVCIVLRSLALCILHRTLVAMCFFFFSLFLSTSHTRLFGPSPTSEEKKKQSRGAYVSLAFAKRPHPGRAYISPEYDGSKILATW